MRDAVSDSLVTDLRCLRCGGAAPATAFAYLCPQCGEGEDGEDPGILDVRYDYDSVRRALGAGLPAAPEGVFRYLPALPLGAPGAVLPAGGTPLVPAPRLARRLGLRALWLKDETRNPTRCLKDRATAVGVSLAARQGFREIYCASAGNAAISLAAFCAHAGLTCRVFVPAYVSQVRLGWLRRLGAEVHVSEGDYDQAFREAEERGAAAGWYSRNCAYNPFLVEGKKTVAYEIAERLGWETPEVAAVPVGDGCTLGAVGKGFRELQAMRFTEKLPRLLGVQAEGAAPLVARGTAVAAGAGAPGESAAGEPDGEPAADGPAATGALRAAEPAGGSSRRHGVASPTRAVSIAVGRPRNALRVLEEVRASRGGWVAVSDEELAGAQATLAREAGLVCELAAAAGLAGLERLAAEGRLEAETAVVVLTGGRVDEA